MRSEKEIRELLVILQAFNSQEKAIIALKWVLGEYPPTVPETITPAPAAGN
ncbi:MAG: hypothetical protein WB562_18200 [Candidatus Sulfotelmatobacter sp.]